MAGKVPSPDSLAGTPPAASESAPQPYQVIARKYRPQTFGQLVSQEHVRTTIENAITQRRIAHGYIFAGQRGTGKTTVARILARCLNCEQGPTIEPCGKCASCVEIPLGSAPDVIEIDAASNRGINEMRELRENVRYRPARDRYKVFIIDEAHQITNEAFNALLKTLEEPPEWVVFILCTTESHKIPVTIASRCQQFSFRSVDFADLVQRMRWICGEEKIEADEEALAVIAQAGEGSVRDSLSALDQAIACCGTNLKADEVRELLGLFSLDSLGKVAEALRASDSAAMLDIVLDLERNGRSFQHFCRELARYFRNLLVKKIAPKDQRLIGASPVEQDRMAEVAGAFSEEDLTRFLQISLELFKELQYALQPRLHLELGLLRLIYAGRLVKIEEAIAGMGSASGGSMGPGSGPGPGSGSRSSGSRASSVSSIASSAAPVSRPSSSLPGAGPRALSSTPAPINRGANAMAPEQSPEMPVGAAGESGDLRQRVHQALLDKGLMHSLDALAHAELQEAAGTLTVIVADKLSAMTLEGDLKKVIAAVLGPAGKVQVKVGKPVTPAAGSGGGSTAGADAGRAKADLDAEVAARALAHPDVKRFQEAFPQGQIRQVRDLKD